MTKIQSALFAMQDKAYREFHCPLIPNIDPKNVIGVRMPQVRKYAKEIFGSHEAEEFLQKLPHKYYDENNLHAYLIEQIRDFELCVKAVDKFLPFVDNWATCDTMRPKVFKKHKEELLVWIKKWISSNDAQVAKATSQIISTHATARSADVYAVRFGIGMLMSHFLGEDFSEKHLATVAAIRSEEYYIRMMQAWYFATALTKQYDAALPFIEQKKLEAWTHNKAIQKACESHAIPAEHKEELRGFRR